MFRKQQPSYPNFKSTISPHTRLTLHQPVGAHILPHSPRCYRYNPRQKTTRAEKKKEENLFAHGSNKKEKT